MSTRRSVWFAGASLLLLLGATTAAAQGSRITGVVTDSATGQPLPGVTVMVQGTTLRNSTGENGRYQINGVAPGTYTVIAQRARRARASNATRVARICVVHSSHPLDLSTEEAS